jgi:hypothetical protein
LIRTYYECEVRYNKSSDKWRLIDLKMNEWPLIIREERKSEQK